MEPGTPDWWLSRLMQRLLDRQPRYDRLERYYLGEHPLPVGDARYRSVFRVLQKKSRTNYVALIADSPVERMHVVGFRFGRSAEEADADADQMWQANDLDQQSSLVHSAASIFGDTYVLVAPSPEGEPWPLITPEDPRTTVTENDPTRPRVVRAGLRTWIDDEYGTAVAVVYTRSWIATYAGHAPYTSDIGLADPQRPTITRQRFLDINSWQPISIVANEWGTVPIRRFMWRPTWTNDSRGEFEPVLDIQDRINSTILDRLIISRAQAYKQRWAKGIKVNKDEKNKAKPPFDPGADILWVTENADADFGEFTSADIRQVLESVRHDVQDLAAISQTPPHYLIGEIVNASGDALKAAETGLVSKVKERMRSMGQSWEDVIRLGFRVLGDDERASTVDAETLWADPESRSRAELADAALKENSLGVPWSLLMERLQYSPQQIERAKVERQAEEMRKTMQLITQARMMQAAGVAPDPNKPPDNAKQPPAKGAKVNAA